MNIGYMLTKSAMVYRDHPAIVYGDREFTYGQFNARVNCLARALQKLGLVKGDRIGILLGNSPQVLESLFACFKGGFVAVPMNFRLHPDEVEYILNNSAAKALICGEAFKAGIEGIMPNLHDTVYFIEVDSDTASDAPPETENTIKVSSESRDTTFIRTSPVWHAYESLLAAASDAEILADVSPEDPVWLFYTSGTTGKPKGATWTHRIVTMVTLNACADIYPFNHSDIGLHAAPLTHGSGVYSLPLIAKGGTNVILHTERFEPDVVFQLIQDRQVTVLPFMAPTMIKRLLDSDRIGNYDLTSLKCIVYGGAPMYTEDLKDGLTKLGKIFVQLYGQGESPMTITALGREDHDQEQLLVSAGIPRLGLQVKIFDERGQEVPVGQIGEIVARGDTVMAGYWNNPEGTGEILREGWLYTGDMGYMNENGYVFIMDRSKDMIISGGNNIYPREIEEIILKHPAVSEVTVIGVPDQEWGEAVKALVVRQAGANLSAQDVIEHCKNFLASYKKPKLVEIVEALPKNNYGKILKRELREQYWQGMSRRV